MVFKYDSNVIANLSCSMFDTQPNRAIISGEKGLIEIEPTFYAPTKISVVMNTGETTNITNDYKLSLIHI